MRTLLVIVTVIGIGAVVGAVAIGTRVFDGTVVDQPYERGLAWDDDRRRREESGLSVSIDGGAIRTGLNLIVMRVRGPDGGPVADESVELHISRPGTREHEKEYRAVRREDGAYTASVVLSVAGRWEGVVIIERDGRPLEFRHEFYAESPAAAAGGEALGEDLCDIDAGPCAFAGKDGTFVTFEISPRPVRSMANLAFRVRFDGARDITGGGPVVLYLDMPGMYMGENRIVLTPRGGGLHEGKGIIVRCPSGGRTWRARVEMPEADPVNFIFKVDG